MTTTAMRYTATVALLGAIFAAMLTGLPGQVQAGARGVGAQGIGVQGTGVLAQYCAPPQHDSVDFHRIYCRDRG
jgi:hypothetical protein